jgi:serine/threonine protein kinase
VSRADPEAPKTLRDGRYLLQDELGDGGMATVYLAYDCELEVHLAIKLLHPGAGRMRESMVRRLRLEAKAMARLRHPNVLRMSDVFEEGEYTYVVMDLARGGSLNQLVEQLGKLPPRMAIYYTLEVLSALAAAHAEGIVHRDVKPHNVLLDERGRSLLADFGIALIADRDRRTKQGVTMGSVAFMPPEQRLDAASVGPAADIHAVGATLYNLLTGDNPVDLFLAEEGSDRWAGVPESLRPVIAQACNVDPEARFANAGDMAAALTAVREAEAWEQWTPSPTQAQSFPAPSTAFSKQGTPAVRQTLGDLHLSTEFIDATGASRGYSQADEQLEVVPPTVLRPGDPGRTPLRPPASQPVAPTFDTEFEPEVAPPPSMAMMATAAVVFAMLGAGFVFSVAYLWSTYGAAGGDEAALVEPVPVPAPEVAPAPAPQVEPEPEPELEPEPEPEPEPAVPAPVPDRVAAVRPVPEPVAVVAPAPAPVDRVIPGGAEGQPYAGAWAGSYAGQQISLELGGPPTGVQGVVDVMWKGKGYQSNVRGTWSGNTLEIASARHEFTLTLGGGVLSGTMAMANDVGSQAVRFTRP